MTMRTVTLASDGRCIDTNSCGNLKLMKPRVEMMVQTIWGEKLRKFVRVNTKRGEFLADIKTGQLYDSEGRCLSSDVLIMIRATEERVARIDRAAPHTP